MAIIILEGPDGAGKSTLAEALVGMDCPWQLRHSEHTSQPRHHCGAYFEYLEAIEEMMSLKPSVLQVYDRFHLGELVYGPVMRGGSDLDEREGRVIDSLLGKLGSVKVFLDAPDDVLLERAFSTRGEDFVSKSDLVEVARRYRALVADRGDWLTIDTYATSPAQVVSTVWRLAKESELRRCLGA